MEAQCRLCLGTDDLENVFQERNGLPTIEEIQQATSIKILESGSLSKCICRNCIVAIRTATALRVKAAESDLWWRTTCASIQDDFDYFHSENTSTFATTPISHEQLPVNIKKITISDIGKLKALAQVGMKKPKPEPLRPLLPASVFQKITITPLFSSKLRPTTQLTKHTIQTSQSTTSKAQQIKVKIQPTVMKMRQSLRRPVARSYKLVCEICGKISKNRDRFNEHRNCHFNTKPFRCSQCPLRFNARNSQKRHMLVHQNIRPFVCKLCAKAYSALHHLKAHTSEKHSTQEERKYHCNVCKKSFLFNFLLTAHLKNHLNARKNVTANIGE